uniref:Eukaryotic translation initiation factor 3 30 kDa subunit n=1 Tax=Oryza brachyantha TaxID=4533 RepID=J3M8H7_ORYBR
MRRHKQSHDEPIEKFVPNSEEEFAEYAERIARDLLRPYEKRYHYIGLMKAMNRLAVASLTPGNIKEIVSSMSTAANEKLRSEKAADAGKKKPGQKKKRLRVKKAGGQWSRNAGEDYAGDGDHLSS